MDVVVENFKPGVIAQMGLGYEELKKIKPGYYPVLDFSPGSKRPPVQ